MRTPTLHLVRALLVLGFVVAALATSLAAAQETIDIEISEDMTSFVFNGDITYDDGLPAHGSSFVTKGYVYPAGTLDGGNGVLADGSPEFPDAVIGEWICFGTMINDAAHASGGAWVVSTQIINFTNEPGAETIVTTGYEFADATPVARAVSGGTGRYADARGEAVQVMTGLNAGEGVVLSVRVELDASAADAASDAASYAYLGIHDEPAHP